MNVLTGTFLFKLIPDCNMLLLVEKKMIYYLGRPGLYGPAQTNLYDIIEHEHSSMEM